MFRSKRYSAACWVRSGSSLDHQAMMADELFASSIAHRRPGFERTLARDATRGRRRPCAPWRGSDSSATWRPPPWVPFVASNGAGLPVEASLSAGGRGRPPGPRWRCRAAAVARRCLSDLGGAIPDRIGIHGVVGNLVPEVAVVLEGLVVVVELLERRVLLVELGIELLRGLVAAVHDLL